jgi:hypothetical protein
MNKPFSIARTDFRAVWNANKVRVAISPKLAVEVLSRAYEEWLH